MVPGVHVPDPSSVFVSVGPDGIERRGTQEPVVASRVRSGRTLGPGEHGSWVVGSILETLGSRIPTLISLSQEGRIPDPSSTRRFCWVQGQNREHGRELTGALGPVEGRDSRSRRHFYPNHYYGRDKVSHDLPNSLPLIHVLFYR